MEYINSWFLFIYDTVLCGYNICLSVFLFICSATDEHYDCFQFGVYLDSVAVSICMQDWVDERSSRLKISP